MKEAIIYLLAITAAEVVTVFVQPVWGIVCNAIVLVAVVVHSASTGDRRYQNLIVTGTDPFSEDNKPVYTPGRYPSDMVVSYYLCPTTGSSNSGSAYPGTERKRCKV